MTSAEQADVVRYEVPMPPRKGRLETYIWDFGDEVSESIADDFYNPERPIAPFGVLIPVAAHQEADQIIPALGEYAKQEGNQPFTVFLFLNYPDEHERSDQIKFTTRAVQEAKELYPNLDIRSSVMGYNQPVIGQIRRDLWDGVVRVALMDDVYQNESDEFIGVNHDIDTISISRHYIRNIQNYYRGLQSELTADDLTSEVLPIRYTQLRHAYPFDTHPNVARALFWSDFTYRQAYPGGVFEEGLAIPLSCYVKRHGFDSKATAFETRWLVPGAADGIVGTGMETSPRRYIARLGEHGLRGIWSPGSFGATDICRQPDALPEDISEYQLETILLDGLEGSLDLFTSNPTVRQPLYSASSKLGRTILFHRETVENAIGTLTEEITAALEPRFKLAQAVMRRVVGAPAVADLIADESVAKRLIARHTVRAVEGAIEDIRDLKMAQSDEFRALQNYVQSVKMTE